MGTTNLIGQCVAPSMNLQAEDIDGNPVSTVCDFSTSVRFLGFPNCELQVGVAMRGGCESKYIYVDGSDTATEGSIQDGSCDPISVECDNLGNVTVTAYVSFAFEIIYQDQNLIIQEDCLEFFFECPEAEDCKDAGDITIGSYPNGPYEYYTTKG